MSVVIGIDPGLHGGLAALTPDGLDLRIMPVVAVGQKHQYDEQALVAWLTIYAVQHAHVFIEAVHAMPGQGVSGVFAFGQVKGTIIGILATLGVPMTMVSPQKWKKALQVPAAKDGARARASQLLPRHAHQWPLVKHDGR